MHPVSIRCPGRSALLAGLFLSWVGSTGPARAQDPAGTRLLSQPAVSASHIAFVYDGDLWIAGRDGASARRLTTHLGAEMSPRWASGAQLVRSCGS